VSTWKVILATLVIFSAGLWTGAFGLKLLGPQTRTPRQLIVPQRFRTEMLARMTDELELSDEQRKRIDAVLEESQERNREIMALVGPELRDEFRRAIRQIREQLNAEQRARFDELLNQRNRRSAPASSDGRSSRTGAPSP
jgi:hypothetical protein